MDWEGRHISTLWVSEDHRQVKLKQREHFPFTDVSWIFKGNKIPQHTFLWIGSKARGSLL
jgi:hypothetical protein